MAGIFCLGILWHIPSLKELVRDYHQKLWIHKFFEARTRFQYQHAQSLLDRIPISSKQDQLGLNLLRMGHLMGLGDRERVGKIYLETKELFLGLAGELILDLQNQDRMDSLFRDVLSRYSKHKEIYRTPEGSGADLEELVDIGRLYDALVYGSGSGGMSGLLEYALFLRHSEEDSRKLLSLAIELYFLLPEGSRGSVFSLEFFLLAYLVQFGSNEELGTLEKNWKKELEIELSEFVEQSPYHLKAYDLRGAFRLRRGEVSKSLEDWIHVFKIDVSHFSLFSRLNDLLNSHFDSQGIRTLEQYRHAERIRFSHAGFEKALELFSSLLDEQGMVAEMIRDEVHYNMGVIYRNNTQDYEKAIYSFEKILAMGENFRREMALYNLVMCHFQLGNYRECQKRIQELLEAFPSSDHGGKLEIILLYAKSLEIMADFKWEWRGEEKI